MKFLESLQGKDLSKEICVLRIDLNVKDRSNFRLLAILPTFKLLQKAGAKIIILGHEGRPRYGSKEDYKKYSLKPFVGTLSKEIKRKIIFIGFKPHLSKNFFFETRGRIDNAPKGSIFLLENLRFLRGEAENDAKLAKELASLGTFYVNDAFSASHRANASLVGITRFLPSYAGRLLEKEIENLDKARRFNKKPFVIILGGAKVRDKIGLIKNLYPRATHFLVGGGIANTIFMKKGMPIGNSIHEDIPLDKKIVEAMDTKIVLPPDVVWSNNKIEDIGQNAVREYSTIIAKAKSIIWNGPVGLIEDKRFRKGSEAIAKAVMASRADTVIGGGETTILFEKKKLRKNFFISTGGGAMLEYLAGKKLPGIEALK